VSVELGKLKSCHYQGRSRKYKIRYAHCKVDHKYTALQQNEIINY